MQVKVQRVMDLLSGLESIFDLKTCGCEEWGVTLADFSLDGKHI